VQSFEGGNMVAELASHKAGARPTSRRSTSPPRKWGPVKVKTGAGMSKGLYEWMQSAFDMGVLYKNGAITVVRLQLQGPAPHGHALNMLMTKVTMPTLDAFGVARSRRTSTSRCMPEQIRWIKEGGTDVRRRPSARSRRRGTPPTSASSIGRPAVRPRVAKIEGLSWECKVTHDMVGEHRENTIHPTATTISDFTLTISQADLEAWAQKAKSWFVDGNCLEGDEMTGMITLLGPDMKKELATIELLNVGFKEFEANPKLEAQTESVARFKVKCYAEQVKFTPTYVNA
jgi:hypothetical protein